MGDDAENGMMGDDAALPHSIFQKRKQRSMQQLNQTLTRISIQKEHHLRKSKV